MGVKCPKHNVDLEIEMTSLKIFQTEYSVAIGHCPVCHALFVNKELLSANGTVCIDGKSYSYHSALSAAYPPEEISKTAKIAADKEEKKRRKAEKKQRQAARRAAEQEVERNRSQRIAEANQRLLQAKEDAILEVRQRNAQGLSKSYRAKKICYLPSIPKKCPNDGEQLDYVKTVQINMVTTLITQSAWCCFRCKTAFFLNSEREKITTLMNQAEIQASKKVKSMPTPKLSMNDSHLPINLATQENTLYVCKGTIACTRNGHSLTAATGILLGKNGAVIKINTNYCPQCRKYFIGYDEYMRYRQIYGVLLGNIKVTNGSFVQSEAELADESILHMCGYSVNQTDNLSSAERHSILQYLIDSKVSNKPEIIEYLNFFIRRNGKRQNMEEAVRRWNEDLRWVREYQLDRQRHFEIVNIQKNGS